jgi:dTDP-4-amino-4,6-dideoxygalactose transaminase
MEVLDERVAARRAMHSFYEEIFKDIQGVTVFTEPSTDYFSNHWLTAILIDPNLTKGITREDLRNALELDQIESRPLWKPMHLQPVFTGLPYYGHGFCDRLFEIGLCLPSGSNLFEEDLARIRVRINRTFT